MRAAALFGLLSFPLFAGGTAKPLSAPDTSRAARPAAAKQATAQPQVPAKPVPSPAGTVTPAPPPKVTGSQKDFCNIVWGCGLPMPAGYCPDPKYVPKPDFDFDSTRCSEARLLNSRGVPPAHPLYGYNLYRFLGMEYRTLYTIEDDLPISQERLAYLLADLPLSARLVSHFQNEPYTAEYIDAERRHFKGTKGKRLRGDAALISGSSDEKHLFYFGYGVATVAWWTLKGPALMDFSYAPDPAKTGILKYKMKLLVFPGNGVINGIMNLGLFRKVVLSKVKEVLTDITETAKKLAAPGAAASIQGAKDWSAEEKKKIEEFLRLP
jgi:hypothetical protein